MEEVSALNKIGIYLYMNGNKYDGEWKDDKVCGHGKVLIKYRHFILQ